MASLVPFSARSRFLGTLIANAASPPFRLKRFQWRFVRFREADQGSRMVETGGKSPVEFPGHYAASCLPRRRRPDS